jgi:hypothetical protein
LQWEDGEANLERWVVAGEKEGKSTKLKLDRGETKSITELM